MVYLVRSTVRKVNISRQKREKVLRPILIWQLKRGGVALRARPSTKSTRQPRWAVKNNGPRWTENTLWRAKGGSSVCVAKAHTVRRRLCPGVTAMQNIEFPTRGPLHKHAFTPRCYARRLFSSAFEPRLIRSRHVYGFRLGICSAIFSPHFYTFYVFLRVIYRTPFEWIYIYINILWI